MKEYIRKQLDEQIGHIENEYVEGNLDAVERRFSAVSDFILRDEKDFIRGIRDDEKNLKKEMDKIKEDFIKSIETALEREETDERVMYAFQAHETLQAAEQALMGKYGHGLVESLVTYARNLDTNKPLDSNISVATSHKSYDAPSEEIDKVLDRRK